MSNRIYSKEIVTFLNHATYWANEQVKNNIEFTTRLCNDIFSLSTLYNNLSNEMRENQQYPALFNDAYKFDQIANNIERNEININRASKEITLQEFPPLSNNIDINKTSMGNSINNENTNRASMEITLQEFPPLSNNIDINKTSMESNMTEQEAFNREMDELINGYYSNSPYE